LLAGYPCQPFSHAGQRKGADDERHLWPDVARVARELGPSLKWVFLENVAGHVSLGLETVLRELWDMDFTPAAGLFTAAEVGAPHERERVFIVAHRDRHDRSADDRQPDTGPDRRNLIAGGRKDVAHARRAERRQGDESGYFANRNDARWEEEAGWVAEPSNTRNGDLGHSTRSRCEPAWAGTGSEREGGEPLPGARIRDMADACCAERQGKQPGQRDPCGWQEPHGYSPLRGGTGLFPPGPGDSAAWADTVAVAPDLAPATGIGDCLAWAGRLAQAVEVSEQAEIEPSLRRMADGLALRSRALRLLGNGVHPLAAGHAWRTLSAAHGLRPVDMASAEGGHSNRTTVISMIEAAE